MLRGFIAAKAAKLWVEEGVAVETEGRGSSIFAFLTGETVSSF